MPQKFISDLRFVQGELEAIVWEAREGEFLSIDDIENQAKKLGEIIAEEMSRRAEMRHPKTDEPSWGKGLLAWLGIPFLLILMPFAYLFARIFQPSK